MNVWLIMLLGGLLTFAMRFSFIYAFGRFRFPRRCTARCASCPGGFVGDHFPRSVLVQRAARSRPRQSSTTGRAIAVAVALWTRKTSWTIAAGMAALLILQTAF